MGRPFSIASCAASYTDVARCGPFDFNPNSSTAFHWHFTAFPWHFTAFQIFHCLSLISMIILRLRCACRMCAVADCAGCALCPPPTTLALSPASAVLYAEEGSPCVRRPCPAFAAVTADTLSLDFAPDYVVFHGLFPGTRMNVHWIDVYRCRR